MILCDHEIQAAIDEGTIEVSPQPEASQFSSTALDLRVGSDFRRWKTDLLNTPGFNAVVNIDEIVLTDLIDLTEPVEKQGGYVVIEPGDFVFVRTLEKVHLRLESQLAARIEGRSTIARLGMTAHISAPTIHAGFRGKVVLEILNHGPFQIKLKPNESKISQLIFERVSETPNRSILTSYLDQGTPLG